MSENNKYKISPECLSNMEAIIDEAVDDAVLSTLDTLEERIKKVAKSETGDSFKCYSNVVSMITEMREDIKQGKEENL